MKRLLLLSSILALPSLAFPFEPTEDGIFAVFDTSLGEFTAKIAYDGVPLTSANFIGLAEGTIPSFSDATGEPVAATPFYDGQIFNRVIDGLAIHAGDPFPDDNTANGPGYRIPDEMHPNLSHTIPYVISMFNDYCFPCEEYTQTHNPEFFGIGENSGGSRFFITVEPPANSAGPSFLDGHYSIFGVIVDGTEVVEAISNVAVDAQKGRPLEDVVINHVTILRRGAQAQAWDIGQYELPVPEDPGPIVDFKETSSGPAFEFPALEGEDFIVRQSEDLRNWSSSILSAPDENATNLSVQIGEAESRFLQLKTVKRPSVYEERIPNAVFKMTMPLHPLSSKQWTFTFNDNLTNTESPNGFGTITVPGLNSAVLLRYEYHRLPKGARLRVSTQSQQVMTFYLRYTGENTGGFIAWVDDYRDGSVNPNTNVFEPLRFPGTGTFELTIP